MTRLAIIRRIRHQLPPTDVGGDCRTEAPKAAAEAGDVPGVQVLGAESSADEDAQDTWTHGHVGLGQNFRTRTKYQVTKLHCNLVLESCFWPRPM